MSMASMGRECLLPMSITVGMGERREMKMMFM